VRVLVIGSGAREHALVLALRADEDVSEVLCAPGNAGISQIAQTHHVDVSDPQDIAALADRLACDLVVIGPEMPLVNGAADAVRARGIPCFGPSAQAARLEGSKAFAKEVMAEAGVPTADSFVCATMDEVATALERFGAPYVVKDDGLAAGKGVVVTRDRRAAEEHAAACLARADGRVVIEEYLDGPEISLFGISDGSRVLGLQPAQDFKRLLDDDEGPNTGGMGAYSPLPWAPPDLIEDVTERILQPMIDAMTRRGTPFAGLLYAGLALTSRGLRVVEFNARFGDPETQVMLARLRSPLGRLVHAAATNDLGSVSPLEWSTDAAVTVVIAADGYPGQPRSGDPINGLDEANAQPGVQVLHAGTAYDDQGRIVSSGGRVLSVTATGPTLAQARERAYRAVARIDLAGAQVRSDIAAAAAKGTSVSA
jgi:phosphoribosylamine--glycine ligase